jgi:hypothetical protein
MTGRGSVRRPGDVPLGVTVQVLEQGPPNQIGHRAELVSIGPAGCTIRMLADGRVRRVRPGLVRPHVDEAIAADVGGRTAQATRAPGWEWLGWTLAQHLAYRAITVAHLPPGTDGGPLVIVPCGQVKLSRPAPAAELYRGSFHAACRRAAAALTAGGGGVLILSARHGLLGLGPTEIVAPYEQRVDRPGAISAEQLRVQAAQRQVLHTPEVVILSGKAYAALARRVWPHAAAPLLGGRGIGEHLARLARIHRSMSYTI